MKNKNFKWFLLLNLLLLIYSFSTVFSKMAAGEDFLSVKYLLLYGGVLITLGIYAIGWQQVIKRLPLTTAFANKAVTVVWGIIWGALFFSESITVGKIIGAVLVIAGVVLYAKSDNGDEQDG